MATPRHDDPSSLITTPNVGLLIERLQNGAAAEDAVQLLIDSLPSLLDFSGATSVIAARRGGDLEIIGQAGRPLGWIDGATHLLAGTADGASVGVPELWAAHGVQRVHVHRLPSQLGVLVLAWTSGSTPRETPVDAGTELALGLLDAHVARLHAEQELHDLGARVDNAQQLAHMGDYDWHIPTDTNRWSDQLYRIYGHEPQSFNASYERFLSHLHPDDQERITQIHQQAYATGEPYQMIERAVRPDGEVRYLSSNGQVVMDHEGKPVRMRGTCIDITERVLADKERERIAARFRSLVESSPDAILVGDSAGVIVQANQQASQLLGGDPVGRTIEEIVPGSGAGTAAAAALETTGLDGSALRLDVATAQLSNVEDGDDGLLAIFLQDATTRLAREALAAHVGEEQLRRRHALEINDNIVQGLTAALYALELEDSGRVSSYLQQTLTAARGMIDDLATPLLGEELHPQSLVRAAASSLTEG